MTRMDAVRPLIHAVDLAASMWAQCLKVAGDLPHAETSAWYYATEREAIDAIVQPWSDPADGLPAVMVIEDQPHGVRWDTTSKAVARMQGRIIDRMDGLGYLDQILFLPPVTWQRFFAVSRIKGDGPKNAAYAAVAAERGHTPPDLLNQHADAYSALKGAERQKVRERLKKLSTDYTAAFLIAEWAWQQYAIHATFDAPTTQRYTR